MRLANQSQTKAKSDLIATPPSRASVGLRFSAGLQPSQSALDLQASIGNGAVARELQRKAKVPTSKSSSRLYRQTIVPALQRDDSRSVDNEGNEMMSVGGRQFLTAVPADVPWHKGKAQALPPNPKAIYAQLHARCDAICAEQLVAANDMRGDMKYWFAKIYHFVTKHELMQIDAQVYAYPLMKMQEVIAFHATYQQNLENWRAGNKHKVESNWRGAFTAAENASAIYKTKAIEIMDALLPSMQAHIRFDLPRAIAACFESYYAGISGLSLADFYADYRAMSPVFDAAQAELQPEINEAARWFPESGVAGDPTNWHWAQSLGFPFIFLVSHEREHSWEKATDIVGAHQQGITDQRSMNKRLRADAQVRHPMSYASDFEVDDNGLGEEEIKDYDWNHQPK